MGAPRCSASAAGASAAERGCWADAGGGRVIGKRILFSLVLTASAVRAFPGADCLCLMMLTHNPKRELAAYDLAVLATAEEVDVPRQISDEERHALAAS